MQWSLHRGLMLSTDLKSEKALLYLAQYRPLLVNSQRMLYVKKNEKKKELNGEVSQIYPQISSHIHRNSNLFCGEYGG